MGDPLEALPALLAAAGLVPRGIFRFGTDDDAPRGVSGLPARHAILVGNAGASHWRQFTAWRAAQSGHTADPLDSWTRAVVEPIAASVGARAVFPFDRPYHPFQRWAVRAEGLRPSPLGILMHPEYGLWHAYRAALLLEGEMPAGLTDVSGLRAMNQADAAPIHLCDLCVGKPCLKACPVDAWTETGFAYKSCVDHVRSAAGGACRGGGCRDRNACPYATAYRYPDEMQAFHMAAFSRAAPV